MSIAQCDMAFLITYNPNPPFSLKYEVFKELLRRDKPFCLLLTDRVYQTIQFQELFKGKMDDFSIISPHKRYEFLGCNPDGTPKIKEIKAYYSTKKINGEKVKVFKERKLIRKKLVLPCLWYCYKMDFGKNFIQLTE